ncbi:MAG: class II glutamine amidotransferase [Xanthomonadales bacterium]|jgi:predicted glutamine amidotransferase|nr:class II glutamine amidotransferase [Xanthomonadales bacterium]MDH3925007.1 class II glutamine amidotransferase [Xanthomonadales bacterium]MDH4000002.1 class II glutamine amidotransferase [Xanthomonadales bacterium]
MCRFIAYLGQPIIVDELLIKPKNSLVHQSYGAEEMPEALNGDGFGLGWYAHRLSERPGLFRSITPAWNNNNLIYNASLMRTDCLFAHIRAASEGGVSESNSHPFHYDQFLMMHNGVIPQFKRIKRKLLSLLNDDLFLWIQGQTDSEHVFALLMQNAYELRGDGPPLTTKQIQACFQKTFDTVQQLKEEAGIGEEVSTFNMMVTDGYRIVGTRYSSMPEDQSRTLYYSTGKRFETINGKSRMVKDGEKTEAVLIVSEKLTDYEEDWTPIPSNHFVAVTTRLEVNLSPMSQ